MNHPGTSPILSVRIAVAWPLAPSFQCGAALDFSRNLWRSGSPIWQTIGFAPPSPRVRLPAASPCEGRCRALWRGAGRSGSPLLSFTLCRDLSLVTGRTRDKPANSFCLVAPARSEESPLSPRFRPGFRPLFPRALGAFTAPHMNKVVPFCGPLWNVVCSMLIKFRGGACRLLEALSFIQGKRCSCALPPNLLLSCANADLPSSVRWRLRSATSPRQYS